MTLDAPYEGDGTVIAMPHQDTDGDQQYDFVDEEGSADGPYFDGEDPVLDDAQLTVETGGTSGDQMGGNGKENVAGDDGAGFGAVVALLAVVGSVLVARRRA